jgi:hypothetical protein
MILIRAQESALQHFSSHAKARRESDDAQIAEILRMSDVRREDFDRAIAHLKKHARAALHFHPDRPRPDQKSVARALLDEGLYRNQFETRISNGSVSAHPGGERDRWEKALYGGAYHETESPPEHRPKYGALDLLRHPDGPAPRFGSCYFILKPAVLSRCTFTYLDSHYEPSERGTIEAFEPIVAGLFAEAFTRDFALGEHGLTVPKLIERLMRLAEPYPDPGTSAMRRNLNHYIEAQIHGPVSLGEDVEMLVADPSFSCSETGETLEAICAKHGIALRWHLGFALAVDDVPGDFRGASMPSLARRVASGSEFIDAQMIGAAVTSLRRNPNAWSDRGSLDQILQELKLLWHVLVRCGLPLSSLQTLV